MSENGPVTGQSGFRAIASSGIVLLLHIALALCFLSNRRPDQIEPANLKPLWIIPIAQAPQLTQPAQHRLARDNLRADQSSPRAARRPPAAIVLPTAPQVTSDQPVQPMPDLETMRAQAVEQEMRRVKSPVEIMNEQHLKNSSIETHLEDAATQAHRTDCLKAYSDVGLFAPLMIARDLIRDKGCKF